jgi:hypothetical protein
MTFPTLTETSSLYREALRGETPYVDADGCPSGSLMTQLWLARDITTAEFGREVLRLIEEDVAAGTVPWDVHDFSKLHNYVDANEYTLTVCGYDGSDAGTDLANALRGERPSSPEYGRAWHELPRSRHHWWTPGRWLAYLAAADEQASWTGEEEDGA